MGVGLLVNKLKALFTPPMKMTVEEALNNTLEVIYHSDKLYQTSKSISWFEKRLSFLHLLSVFDTVAEEHRDVFLSHVGRRMRGFVALFYMHNSSLANVDVYMIIGLLFETFGLKDPKLRAEACSYYMHSISTLCSGNDFDKFGNLSEKEMEEIFENYAKGLVDTSMVCVGDYKFDLESIPMTYAGPYIHLTSRIFRAMTFGNSAFDEDKLIQMFEKCEEMLNGDIPVELTLDFLQAISTKKRFRLAISIYDEIINDYIENAVPAIKSAAQAVRPLNSWLFYCIALNNFPKRKKMFHAQLNQFVEFLKILVNDFDASQVMAMLNYWRFEMDLKASLETWIPITKFQLEVIEGHPLTFKFEFKAQMILLHVVHLYHDRQYGIAKDVLLDYSKREGFEYLLNDALKLQYAVILMWVEMANYCDYDREALDRIRECFAIASKGFLNGTESRIVLAKLQLFVDGLKDHRARDLMSNLLDAAWETKKLARDGVSVELVGEHDLPEELIKPLLEIEMDDFPLEIYQFANVENINKIRVV